MVIAGTGHRPAKLGGYTKAVENRLIDTATVWLKENKPRRIISGMALGWDQALAQAAVNLDLWVVAAIPFPSHHLIWPHWQIEKYITLLSKCKQVHTICQGTYEVWKMQERNKWMVDNCDKILALWDGSTGGANNCIQYAEEKHKPIINLWEQYRAAAKSLQI